MSDKFKEQLKALGMSILVGILMAICTEVIEFVKNLDFGVAQNGASGIASTATYLKYAFKRNA